MIQTKVALRHVRHILNEYPSIEGDMYEQESDEGLREFLASAMQLLPDDDLPTAEMNAGKSIEYRQRPDGMYYGVLTLPEDYLRFVSLKLDPWPLPMYIVTPVGGSLWQAQFAEAAGVGNGECMPAVFMGVDSGHTIEAHAVKASRIKEVEKEVTDEETGEKTTVTELEVPGYVLRYLALPSVEGDSLNISKKSFEPLCYYAAGLYLQAHDNNAGADRCMVTAKGFLNIATSD